MAILPASQAYNDALEDLTTIVQDAYDDISVGMLLEIEDSSPKKTFVQVGTKQPKYDTVMYDFNLAGRTLVVNDTTGYGSAPSVAISYTNNKAHNEILTKNTPEVTDDPETVTSLTASDFANQTSWRSNFYL